MHKAFLGPRDPSRAPTTKDFAEERRPLEVGQSPRLSTQIDLKPRRDKIDVLALRERDPIADDGARPIRVVWCVGDDRGAIRARQLERILQMFQVRRIGYLSG
jgi:hypothetical protein